MKVLGSPMDSTSFCSLYTNHWPKQLIPRPPPLCRRLRLLHAPLDWCTDLDPETTVPSPCQHKRPLRPSFSRAQESVVPDLRGTSQTFRAQDAIERSTTDSRFLLGERSRRMILPSRPIRTLDGISVTP